MNTVKIHDKEFVPYLAFEEIEHAIKKIANTIYAEYKDEAPVFVGVLNGVIMFMSDFLKQYPGDCEISFLRMASYEGTQSTGNVEDRMQFDFDLTNRHIIILEDIVDTGNTLEALYKKIESLPAASVKIATLLFKPDAFKKDLNIDYIGMSIPDKFVVGYGLDYDGYGRNLPDIYQIKLD